MELVKINADTWRIEDGFVRCFLLIGEKKALLMDSGASGEDVKTLAESVTELPILLLNTHGDGDHTAGNAQFGAMFMHPADYSGCGIAKKFPNCRLIPIADGNTIDLGGRVLRLIAIPGHTFGSVAVLDCRDRVLYPGDSVQNGHIYLFGKHRAPEQFAASLRKLEGLRERYDRVYPSHGEADLPAEAVGQVLEAWTAVQNGAVPGEPISMHGANVVSYTADACGFYCEF